MKYNYDAFVNREISWLEFNARVLQESEDKSVPLITRLRFLGIFSNNLDEFFKIRYATVKQIVNSGKSAKKNLGGVTSKELLEEITKIVIDQQDKSLVVLQNIIHELKSENIYIVKETELLPTQKSYINTYFIKHISNKLSTIILNKNTPFPNLKGSAIYLAVRMVLNNKTNSSSPINNKIFALIEIPKDLNRFIVLPRKEDKHFVMMADDVIRFCLSKIFNIFDYLSIQAHMIKITRDAELDLDTDLSKSFIEKLSESVRDRAFSKPVRLIYDKKIGNDTLAFLMKKMKLDDIDSIIPGGRYHNRSDYTNFPKLGRSDLTYSDQEPLEIKDLSLKEPIINKIEQRDFLQFTPYHSFSYVIKFLREIAIDSSVHSVKMTLYRLAKSSDVVNALINAAKNGKRVTVLIELKARFDEVANIKNAKLLETEGVNVIFGVDHLKVHSKLCIATKRVTGKKDRHIGFISTGNFNEQTAKVYSDLTLFTANQKILKEVEKVFHFFKANYIVNKYKHLVVSPHYTDKVFIKLIDNEIKNAKEHKPAYIKLKMNNLTNLKMIESLYEASKVGVKIQLIIRGICCLKPGIPGISENIQVISIIDKYLEHTRLVIFCNNNKPKVYISSADWMTRNIKYRVEVSCPIYSQAIAQEIIDIFDMGWQDNVKSRLVSDGLENKYRTNLQPKKQSQRVIYDYLKNKLNP